MKDIPWWMPNICAWVPDIKDLLLILIVIKAFEFWFYFKVEDMNYRRSIHQNEQICDWLKKIYYKGK